MAHWLLLLLLMLLLLSLLLSAWATRLLAPHDDDGDSSRREPTVRVQSSLYDALSVDSTNKRQSSRIVRLLRLSLS
jgi:hypothetical protein